MRPESSNFLGEIQDMIWKRMLVRAFFQEIFEHKAFLVGWGAFTKKSRGISKIHDLVHVFSHGFSRGP